MLFALSILVVFLALAALYESWAIPLAVILVVPLGVIGALLGVTARHAQRHLLQVGLIATIGLSAKNAILIVEVAKDLVRDGQGLMSATLEAARLRLRPIIMTSLAFGVGVLPWLWPAARPPARRSPSAPACWAASSPPPCSPFSWCRSFSWSWAG